MDDALSRYPPISEHGVIGDRRSAALVAADGSVDWCCLPDFDSATVFGALLDVDRGGSWRLGPADRRPGRQSYLDDSAVLCTRWTSNGGGLLELTDHMPWPDDRPDAWYAQGRTILRRLRARGGSFRCIHQLDPRRMFAEALPVLSHSAEANGTASRRHWLGFWCSDPRLQPGPDVATSFELADGESIWMALTWGGDPEAWTVPRAQEALGQTLHAWARWAARHPFAGADRKLVMQSVRTIRLLGYAPSGSQVAAPTFGLPEKMGSQRNYDYRFAWVRDASLALAILSVLGDRETAEAYMDWLSSLPSETEMPLQVLYRIEGGCNAEQQELEEVAGYADSQPVRIGNQAARQFQLDSLGYLADCAYIYLKQGGRWKPGYTEMMDRVAKFTLANWSRPDNGIWELSEQRHYVSSKVLAWTVFDRMGKIYRKRGRTPDPRWQHAAEAIREEVMTRGWDPGRRAFRQHYETTDLDASALLLPIMSFLPADHPRVISTVAAIQRELQKGGFVWRFHPRSQGKQGLPLDGLEGAFIPCTFWLAATLAQMGRTDEARQIIDRVDASFGRRGLLSEEFDPATGQALGNYPLLFSHAEHLKAVMELTKAQPLQMAAMMAGKMAGKIVRGLTKN